MLTKFKNEDGSGLILALMTLMVLSVLGAALGAITIGGYRLSSVNRDTTSAYYIAEAGVNQAYEEMSSLVNSAYESSTTEEGFFSVIESSEYKDGKAITGFGNQFGDSPEAQVKLMKLDVQGKTRSYSLVSDGNVDNRNRIVEKPFDVTWVDKGSGGLPTLPDKASLIVKDEIDFSNGSIFGDIYFKSTNSGSFKLSNSGTVTGNRSNIYLPALDTNVFTSSSGESVTNGFKGRSNIDNKTKSWIDYVDAINDIKFPSKDSFSPLTDKKVFNGSNSHDVQKNNSLFVNNWIVPNYDLKLERDIFIDKLVVDSGYTLNLIADNNSNNIFVNELIMPQGFINIIGSGEVNIFVSNKVSFGGGSQINRNGSYSQLNFYYFGKSRFSLEGSQSINGSLFNDTAEINLGASGNVTGSIFSRATSSDINISGGSNNNILLYAPNSKVNFPNGKISGVVLAKSFNISGGATLEYQPFELYNFPFLNAISNNEENLSADLIKSEPIIEQR